MPLDWGSVVSAIHLDRELGAKPPRPTSTIGLARRPADEATCGSCAPFPLPRIGARLAIVDASDGSVVRLLVKTMKAARLTRR